MTHISVVIPTYNRLHQVSRLLRLFQYQDDSGFEIVVVDDGSTDKTYETLTENQNSRITVLRIENSERAFARDYGANEASGDYINFFDSDDIVYPNHIAEAKKLIHSLNYPPILVFNSEYLQNNRPVKKFFKDSANGNDLIEHGNSVPLNGVFIRKDVYHQNRFCFDRNLSGSEDYELWTRLFYLFDVSVCNTVTSCLINHATRSVNTISPAKVIPQCRALSNCINNFEVTVKISPRQSIHGYIRRFLSVHISKYKEFKWLGLRLLMASIFKSGSYRHLPSYIAIIRNLLFFYW